MNIEINTWTLNLPGYVRIIIMIYFVICIFSMKELLSILCGYISLKKFFKENRNNLENIIKKEKSNGRVLKNSIYWFVSSNIHNALQSIKLNIQMDYQSFQIIETNLINKIKIFFTSIITRQIFLILFAVSLFLIMLTIEIENAINLTIDFSLKAGVISFYDSFYILSLACILLIFLVTACCLFAVILKGWICLQILDFKIKKDNKS